MKKTLLLTSLVASMVAMAGTTGSVEGYSENKTTYEKGSDFLTGLKTTESTFGVKTEVKVKDSGFSFGADLKAKELKLFNAATTVDTVLTNVKSNSNVWAKYELPELKGVKSYVKATYETAGTLKGEADASYKVLENITAGVNSETSVDLKAVLGADKITSTHKVYVKGDYSVVKGIEGELGFSHNYTKPSTSVQSVFLNAKASYDVMKDLKLTGKVNFKHKINAEKVEEDSLLTGDKIKADYLHSYLVSGVYTGVKATELKLDAFIEHYQKDASEYALNFGFKPEVKYTGVENLVLSSKNVLGGTAEIKADGTTKGYAKLNANAEYTYKATDKVSVKPSLDVTAKFSEIEGTKFKAALEITPKVAVEYKPVESLTLSGDVAPVVKFSGNQAGFDYTNTTVKSNFNVKYTW
ncbi:hypothetical protein [uncultured Sneathia sp.]|uniref:hypothetical protein n=1 Tax=uncultured Sneathia sp. TaxID=278067 RepID=UPI00259707FB|nr:hypothetical protein [uncultured Sneathia sp.]